MSERRDEEPEGSWLDEVSWATKLVLVVSAVSIAAYLMFLLANLFF